MADSGERSGDTLTPGEASRLEEIRAAETLTDLQSVMGTGSEHDAYMAAKAEWKRLRGKELGEPEPADGIPGDTVVVNGQQFVVHGVTHADTEAERTFLRDHVREYLERGESVYCEQGIRPMYFGDMEAVCEIDDYRWAMHHCREIDVSSHIDGVIESAFEEPAGVGAEVKSIASRFRDVTFSLIESGTDVYGEQFGSVLGDVASDFLTDHAEIATGEDFTSFAKSERAATDPAYLGDLQHYYKQVFLPQPLEREWLRRHDRELEIFTHARNERIAEYVLYHGSDTTPVHLVVGAAHQPGVLYYLNEYRNDNRDVEEFEFVP